MDNNELDKFVTDARRVFGEEVLFLPKFKPVSIEWIPTGIMTLDYLFGNGIPRGRLIEIYGPESSGKTTLTLEMLRAVQSAGLRGMFMDVEHALDPTYAKSLGVNLDEMPISQPDSAEEALNLMAFAIESGVFGVIVLDSVAGLVPKAERDGEIGDKHMALVAQLMSETLRKIVGMCAKSKTTVIFTNQIRSKVGVIYGSPEVTTGGNALKFYASIRADVRRRDKIGEDGKFEGIVSEVKIVKNKVAPPFKTAMLSIMFGKGIDRVNDAIEFMKSSGQIVTRGGKFFMGDLALGNAEGMRTYVMEKVLKKSKEVDKHGQAKEEKAHGK